MHDQTDFVDKSKIAEVVEFKANANKDGVMWRTLLLN